MSVSAHLQALEQAGLIRLAGSPLEAEFAFRHSLVGEAAYLSLLRHQRRDLHRVVGEVLERRAAGALDEVAPVLAEHFDQAGDVRKARRYYARAGDVAASRFAGPEALRYYTRAIEAGGHPPADLLRRRGLVHELRGEFDTARADFEAALRGARAAAEPRLEWQILMHLALLWAGRDYVRSGEFCRAAHDAARAVGDPALIAHSLNRLGNWYVNREAPEEGRRYHEQALEVFRSLGDHAGVAATLDLLGMTAYMGADLPRSGDCYRQALEHYQASDDSLGHVSSLIFQLLPPGGFYNGWGMRPADSARQDLSGLGEAALARAADIGWRSGQAFAMVVLTLYTGPRGDYARAVRFGQQGAALAAEIGHRQWMTAGQYALGALYSDLNARPEALTALQRAFALAIEIDSLHWIDTCRAWLAVLFLEQGDPVAARRLVPEAGDAPLRPHTKSGRFLARAQAELALAQGRPELALAVVDYLAQTTAGPDEPPAELPVPELAHQRARVLAVLGRLAEAEAELRAGLEAAQVFGQRAMLWRLRLELGRLLARQGRRVEAQAELAAARQVMTRLAALIPDDRLRAGFLQQLPRYA
jgi:tetratricopeptide (TPR) repeat protein